MKPVWCLVALVFGLGAGAPGLAAGRTAAPPPGAADSLGVPAAADSVAVGGGEEPVRDIAPLGLSDWHPPVPGHSALKSMAMPGWGQLANGRPVRAALFFGAYAGMFAWAAAVNQDRMDAEGRLHAALGTADEAYWKSEVSRLKDARNGKFWLGGLVVLLSMAEAYVDAQLYRFDERIDADVAIWDTGAGPAAGVVVRVALGGR